jgi:cation transport regulator ChaC
MELWVFGYCSLVWKAGFGYDERIKEYTRVLTELLGVHHGDQKTSF